MTFPAASASSSAKVTRSALTSMVTRCREVLLVRLCLCKMFMSLDMIEVLFQTSGCTYATGQRLQLKVMNNKRLDLWTWKRWVWAAKCKKPKRSIPKECVLHSAMFPIACGRCLNHFKLQAGKNLVNQLNHLLKRKRSSLSFLRTHQACFGVIPLRKSSSDDNFIPDPPCSTTPCKCLCLFHHQNLPAGEPRNTKDMAVWFKQPINWEILSCGM